MAVRVQIGRLRHTRAVVTPTEAGYIKFMRGQAKQLQTIISNVVTNVKGATTEAIRFGLRPVYDKSQEYVPVDTGALKRSAFLEDRPTVRGPMVYIGYAKGGRPWYASLVHENLTFRHAKGKYAKFLERAINEELHKIMPRVTYYMRHNTGLKG